MTGRIALVALMLCCGDREQPVKDRARPPAPAPTPDEPEPPPHPMYPTAKSSGSEGVFALEEPDRGPLVTELAIGSLAGAATSEHGHCEVDEAAIRCGPRGKGWRVHRQRSRVVAERLWADGAIESVDVLELDDAGRAARMIRVDGGVVSSSRHYVSGGRRYSARWRSGANALPGCGSIALVVDERHRSIRRTCLQWMGQPMRDEHGVASAALGRDSSDLITEIRYLDAAGKPAARHDGVHREQIRRDDLGRRVGVAYFDVAGKPIASSENGCVEIRRTLDAGGRATERRCLDGAGALATDASGVAVTRFRRDRRGCTRALRFFDADGTAARSRFRGFGLEVEVDDRCLPVAETCVDAGGKPAACAFGEHARVVYRRDRDGEIISASYFSPDNEPAVAPDLAAHEIRRRRDERGREIEWSCFAQGAVAIECPGTGYHRTVTTVDDAGRSISQRFFDAGGAPTTNVGSFTTRIVYDNYDHPVRSDNFDRHGEPIAALGSSSQQMIYDDGHRLFAVLLFLRGEPARYTGCFTGRTCPESDWHAVRVVRGPSGELDKNVFFDHRRQLVKEIGCRVNRCFGLDDE